MHQALITALTFMALYLSATPVKAELLDNAALHGLELGMKQTTAATLHSQLSKRSNCRQDHRGNPQCMGLVEGRTFLGVPFDAIAVTYKSGSLQEIAVMSGLPKTAEECSHDLEAVTRSLERRLGKPRRSASGTGWMDNQSVITIQRGAEPICWRMGYSTRHYYDYRVKVDRTTRSR